MRIRSLLACLSALTVFCAADALAEIEYTGKSFPDPFADNSKPKPSGTAQKPAAPKVDLSGLSVQGIVVSPDGNLAIVKGKVVKVGDLIQGFRVHAIEPDGVFFASADANQKKLYKITHKGQATP